MLIFRIGQRECCFLFCLYRQPIQWLLTTMTNSLFNYLTYRTINHWCSVDAQFQNGAGRVSISLVCRNEANTWYILVCIQSPTRFAMMPEQNSLKRHCLSCSGWGRERVAVVVAYIGSPEIRKGQWHSKVTILLSGIGYINVTINRTTQSTVREIGTGRTKKPRHNLRVDWDGSRFRLTWCSGSYCWTVLEANQTIFAIRTHTRS
jgi:hypothetical protein